MNSEIRPITKLEEKSSPLGDTFTWQSAERFWEPKDRAWFVTYSLMFVVIIAFAAILTEYIFILALVAFVFLWFIQAAVPPQTVRHTISPLGVKTFGKLYKWNHIAHFWFSEKHGIKFLNLDLYREYAKPDSDFRKRISLLLENEEDMEIFFLLIDNVDYGDTEEIGYNTLTRFINGKHIAMSKYLPYGSDDDDYEIDDVDEVMEVATSPKKKTSGHRAKKHMR